MTSNPGSRDTDPGGRRSRSALGSAVERLEDRRLLCAAGHADPHDLAVTPEAAPLAAATSVGAQPAASTSAARHPLSSLPVLASRPGARATLYLDFNGDTTTSSWGTYHPGKTPAVDADGDPTTFTDGELATVREAWARVAEDFAPFDLNVTTVDPGAYGNGKAMRVVVGGKSTWYGSAVAGLSFVGAFSNEQPNTSFVFVNGSNAGYMADIISHEAGHSFGLGHQEVYNADGSVADAYADGDSTSTPLMGGGGGRSVWWHGDSGGLGRVQDDSDVIGGAANGFGYRPDDHGNTSFLSTPLARDAVTGGWVGAGVIETVGDHDWFGVTLATGGDTIVTVSPAAHGPNLNARVELRDLVGGLIASYDSADLGESFAVALRAGAYRVGVASHGREGDVGQYTVSVAQPNLPRTQTPFGAAPVAVAASGATTIAAQHFDFGGEGLAYHDTGAANTGAVYRPNEGVDLKTTADADGGGFRLSDTRPGEWVEYTLDVARAGPYALDLRVSNSKSGGRLHVEANGVNVTGDVAVPNTGSFNTFATVSKPVALPAGRVVLRVAFDAVPGGGDAVAGLHWLRLGPAALPGSVLSAASPVRVTSGTAAYVREGTTAGTNYGADGRLAVKGSTTGAARESYLTFDLLSLPSTIGTATLRLYGNLSASLAGGLGVDVYAAAETSWNEKTLTWKNRPGSVGGTLASFAVAGTTARWYEVNLTGYLKAQRAAGRTSVTLVLKGLGNTSPYAQFNSDDASGKRPQLLITG